MLTKSQKDALGWLTKRGGSGVFDKNGVLIAAGAKAPVRRSTWNALRDAGLVEIYTPEGSTGKRVRIVE